jgi:hypothetical protein
MRPMWLSDCGGMQEFKDLEMDTEWNGSGKCRCDINDFLFPGTYWINIFWHTYTQNNYGVPGVILLRLSTFPN